jgi:Ca2+-binding RTX toxin-like protein
MLEAHYDAPSYPYTGYQYKLSVVNSDIVLNLKTDPIYGIVDQTVTLRGLAGQTLTGANGKTFVIRDNGEGQSYTQTGTANNDTLNSAGFDNTSTHQPIETISALAGNDTVNIGNGQTTVTLGAGADTYKLHAYGDYDSYRVASAERGTHVITDFQVGVDRLQMISDSDSGYVLDSFSTAENIIRLLEYNYDGPSYPYTGYQYKLSVVNSDLVLNLKTDPIYGVVDQTVTLRGLAGQTLAGANGKTFVIRDNGEGQSYTQTGTANADTLNSANYGITTSHQPTETILAGGGNDTVNIGNGQTTVTLGAGADVYNIFGYGDYNTNSIYSAERGTHVITDFQVGVDRFVAYSAADSNVMIDAFSTVADITRLLNASEGNTSILFNGYEYELGVQGNNLVFHMDAPGYGDVDQTVILTNAALSLGPVEPEWHC